MMTQDEIRELAAFQADESKGACALSFYFQPDPPQDRSHRREAIVAKDVVKQALKSAVASGKNGSVHADLDRVLRNREIEAVVQTSIGGLLGTATGLAMVFGIPLISKIFSKKPLPAQLDVMSIFLSLSVAVGVGVLFGWYPARRASRLDPIEALRHN